ncbi:MAG: hypothetical protein Q8R07_03170 [Candidatus Uhrbacteria bacterium]|nr:hypothetical protein [Candidatus Uhrbacteria bacterium]
MPKKYAPLVSRLIETHNQPMSTWEAFRLFKDYEKFWTGQLASRLAILNRFMSEAGRPYRLFFVLRGKMISENQVQFFRIIIR